MIVKNTTRPDILLRLLARADCGGPDEALFREAAKTIETLHSLIGIRQEIELEDSELEGHA